MSGRIMQSAMDLPKDKKKSKNNEEVPPPLPSRFGRAGKGKPPNTPPVSSGPSTTNKWCSCSEEECTGKHPYEDIITPVSRTEVDSHQYEKLRDLKEDCGDNILLKLKKIEDNQTRLRNEFDEFRGRVIRDIVSLQTSVNRVLEITDNLEDFARDSLTRLESSMEKMHFQLLENSDHLGKQILDVRRDIMGTTAGQNSPFRSNGGTLEKKQLKKYTHTFDWEVGNLDSLSKSQKSASSQSYLISELDFKILGGAVCDKDGHLHVKVYGEFTHKPSKPWEKNCGFECSVYMMDKSGKKPDFMIGNIRSDFNSGKEWNIGDVSVNEIKDLGYAVKNGNVYLKFVIEIYA